MSYAKKAQGLPLNTIIIAIIVIVVLVVIILIFTGQIGGVNRAAQEGQGCRQIGGYCAPAMSGGTIIQDPCSTFGATVSSINLNDCGTNMVCCIRG